MIYTRQGFRDAAAPFNAMAQQVAAFARALEGAPGEDDFAQAVAEDAAARALEAFDALRALAAALHR